LLHGRNVRFSDDITLFEFAPGFCRHSLDIAWDVSEASIPGAYREAVRRGIAGLFESDAKFEDFLPNRLCVRVVGGSHHETDSNESSYVIAAAMAFVNAVESAHAAEGV
jgi:hypothetical protein